MSTLLALSVLGVAMLAFGLTDAYHLVIAGVLGGTVCGVSLWWRRRQQNPDADFVDVDGTPEAPNRLRQAVFGTAVGVLATITLAGAAALGARTPAYALFYDRDCVALDGTLETLRQAKGYEHGVRLADERLGRKASAECRQLLVTRQAHLLVDWAMSQDGGARVERLRAARTAATEGRLSDLVARIDSELRAVELQAEAAALKEALTRHALASRVTSTEVVITFADVLFDVGRETLTAEGTSAARQAAAVLNGQAAGKAVVLEGHTDDTGPAALNDRLSRQRAESVRTALVSAGVSADRLTAIGRGSAQPVDTSGTLEGRAANRRVEIVIRK